MLKKSLPFFLLVSISFLFISSFSNVSADNIDIDDPSQYKTREDFLDANARYGVKYYFSPDGHVFTKDGTDITPPEMLREAGQNAGKPSVFDFFSRLFGNGDMKNFEPPIPSSAKDDWNFLPDFKPGESVYENTSRSQPDVPANPQAADKPRKTIFGSFGNEQNDQPKSPVQDSNPQADTSQDGGAMPIAPEEHLEVPQDQPKDQPPVPNPQKYFDRPFFERANEPESKEIDYNQYGDKTVFDPQTGTVSVIQSGTNQITTFRRREDVLFGPEYGGTSAITERDGKIVHEDRYDRDGNLTHSVSIDPNTGVRTSTQFHHDGTQTVTKTDAEGNPVVNKASATDPETGETITAEGNPDGSKTVTKKDKDGNIISEENRKKDENTLIEGTVTDPKTGETRFGKKLKDGTTVIEVKDKNGKLIRTEQRNSSGKLITQKSSFNAFKAYDQLSRGPMGALSSDMVPTAAVDTPILSRNMNSDASQGHDGAKGPECET